MRKKGEIVGRGIWKKRRILWRWRYTMESRKRFMSASAVAEANSAGTMAPLAIE